MQEVYIGILQKNKHKFWKFKAASNKLKSVHVKQTSTIVIGYKTVGSLKSFHVYLKWDSGILKIVFICT